MPSLCAQQAAEPAEDRQPRLLDLGCLGEPSLQAAGEDWQWFTYINDDDELGPEFSRIAERHFARADPEPVVYGNVRVIDEDADLRASLVPMGPAALAFLRRVLEAPEGQQDEVLRRLMAHDAIGMGQLIATAMSDNEVRLRVLRAIRNLSSAES